MASNARKELVKQLRATFTAEATHGGSQSFEDFEPPESLIETIDNFASSSDIEHSTTERDIQRIKQVLVEECLDTIQTSGTVQAKNALVIVLDTFSGLDSAVVTPTEVRDVWWPKLLLPMLQHATSDSPHIQIGRPAARSIKSLLIRTLIGLPSVNGATSDDEETASGTLQQEQKLSEEWRKEVLRYYVESKDDSFIARMLQEALSAWGKSHPKDFFTALTGTLATKPVPTLLLLNGFIRAQPVQAYQILQTSLLDSLLRHLSAISSPQLPADGPVEADPAAVSVSASAAAETPTNSQSPVYTKEDDAIWIGLSLTSLNMLLPRLSAFMDKNLHTLFLVLVRGLLWRDSLTQQHRMGQASYEREEKGENDEGEDLEAVKEQNDAQTDISEDNHKCPCLPFPPLLDFFSTLYGLYPANLLYFLTNPVQWLVSYARRINRRKRQSTGAGSSNRLLRPTSTLEGQSGTGSGGETSTSGDESFPAGGESDLTDNDRAESGNEERGGQPSYSKSKRSSKSKPHGKGRRSKLKKQKTTAMNKDKKDKKDREKRRKSLANAESATVQSDNLQEVSGEANAIQLQVTPADDLPGGAENKENKEVAEEASASSVNNDDDENSSEEDEDTSVIIQEEIDIGQKLLRLNWTAVRTLSGPYLALHVLTSHALCSPQVEFARNKLRYKKLVVADLVEQIVKSRVQSFGPEIETSRIGESAGTSGIEAASIRTGATAAGLKSPEGFPFIPLANALAFAVAEDPKPNPNIDVMMLLQNQLNYENYQKSQLVQRLGTILHDHVEESSHVANVQNLKHTIRLLRNQLEHSREKLADVRKEAGKARDLLNDYSSRQATRLDTLREERKQYTQENNKLKSELEELNASLKVINQELMESRSKVFDLEAEFNLQRSTDSPKDVEIEKLKAEIERLRSQTSAQPSRPEGTPEALTAEEKARTDESDASTRAD